MKKLIFNGILSVLGAGIFRLAVLIMSLQVAKLGTTNDLASFFLVMAISVFGCSVLTFGMPLLLIRQIALQTEDDSKGMHKLIKCTFLFFIPLAGVISFGGSMGSFYLNNLIFHGAIDEDCAKIATPILAFSILNSLTSSCLQGMQAYRILFSLNIIIYSITLLSVFIFPTHGCMQILQIFCFSQFIFLIATAIVLLLKLNKITIVPSERIALSLNDIWYNYFYSVSWMGIIFWFNHVMSKFGADEIAAYNLGNQLFSVIVFIPNVLGGVLIPFMFKAINSKSSSELNAMRQIQIAFAIFAIMIILVFILISPYISYVFGLRTEATHVLIAFSIAAFASIVMTPSVNKIIAVGQAKKLLWSAGVFVVVSLLLYQVLFFSPSLNASCALSVAYCFACVVSLLSSRNLGEKN